MYDSHTSKSSGIPSPAQPHPSPCCTPHLVSRPIRYVAGCASTVCSGGPLARLSQTTRPPGQVAGLRPVSHQQVKWTNANAGRLPSGSPVPLRARVWMPHRIRNARGACVARRRLSWSLRNQIKALTTSRRARRGQAIIARMCVKVSQDQTSRATRVWGDATRVIESMLICLFFAFCVCLEKQKRSKRKSHPPRARTDPYQAPYFFPAPGSPEARDYVRRVRSDRSLPRTTTILRETIAEPLPVPKILPSDVPLVDSPPPSRRTSYDTRKSTSRHASPERTRSQLRMRRTMRYACIFV